MKKSINPNLQYTVQAQLVQQLISGISPFQWTRKKKKKIAQHCSIPVPSSERGLLTEIRGVLCESCYSTVQFSVVAVVKWCDDESREMWGLFI